MHSLQFIGLRWTRVCIASTATALFTSVMASHASASHRHALQPGESLDAVARRYHVSIPDLIRVNNITNQDNIPDGKMLMIPNPPRSLKVASEMHKRAHVGKDSVSVRLGPGLEYRRMNFAYEGDAVVVTAEQDSWAQITTANGESGWVLQSLLHHARHDSAAQTASNRSERDNSDAPAHSRKPKHHADMVALEEDRSRARRVARRQASALPASHRRHAQQQEPGERKQGAENREQAANHSGHGSKKHSDHAQQIARIEHKSASVRHHRHTGDSEPAMSSHTRIAKHSHGDSGTRTEAKVARASRHRHAELALSGAGHHRSERVHARGEQTASIPRHARRHAEQIETRHVAREIGDRDRSHSSGGSGVKVAAARHHRHEASGEADAPEAGSDIVRTAYGYRGTPYVWGGERPGGFDCSGFTMHLYGRKGISLPHSARAQFGMGSHVDKSGMKPGDLVFFHTVTPGISHVGMYVGSGKFVHASSRRSGGVRVDNIDSGYYSQAFRGARRMRRGD